MAEGAFRVILIDSSVWIETLHSPTFRDYARISEIVDENACTCGPVIQEVLQGIREDRVLQEVSNRMDILPYLEATRETYRAAAALFRRCRRKGAQVQPGDALIASIAIENDVSIWTLDEDFTRIRQHAGLRLYR